MKQVKNSRKKAHTISVIGCVHETNTFAPGTTGLESFTSEWVVGSKEFLELYDGTRTSMGGVIDAVRELGLELRPGLYTQSMPSGIVSGEAYETIVQSMLASIEPSADGVVIILHGAMVCESITDPEGDIVRRVRERYGRALPIAVTIDLHGNITPQFVEAADLIVGYDTYPHVDVYDRAVEAVQLLKRTIEGDVKPIRRWKHARQLLAPQAMVTDSGPMKRLLDLAYRMEEDPLVLNVTVIGGFPFSDVPEAGMSFLVTTDGDAALAERCIEQLDTLAWEIREEFQVRLTPPEESVALAEKQRTGPVILVEGSDNVGGGSPADGTHLLPYLLRAEKSSLIVIRDVDAVREANRIGIGGTLLCKVGGKSDRWHGESVTIEGRIRTLFDGEYKHIGKYMTGQRAHMGLSAVVEVGPVTILLTEQRVPPWDPGHVRSVGLRPEAFHMIVVKSAIAWKTAFGDIATMVIDVDTPGCCAANLHTFEYQCLKRPIYPLDSSEEVFSSKNDPLTPNKIHDHS